MVNPFGTFGAARSKAKDRLSHAAAKSKSAAQRVKLSAEVELVRRKITKLKQEFGTQSFETWEDRAYTLQVFNAFKIRIEEQEAVLKAKTAELNYLRNPEGELSRAQQTGESVLYSVGHDEINTPGSGASFAQGADAFQSLGPVYVHDPSEHNVNVGDDSSPRLISELDGNSELIEQALSDAPSDKTPPEPVPATTSLLPVDLNGHSLSKRGQIMKAQGLLQEDAAADQESQAAQMNTDSESGQQAASEDESKPASREDVAPPAQKGSTLVYSNTRCLQCQLVSDMESSNGNLRCPTCDLIFKIPVESPPSGPVDAIQPAQAQAKAPTTTSAPSTLEDGIECIEL